MDRISYDKGFKSEASTHAVIETIDLEPLITALEQAKATKVVPKHANFRADGNNVSPMAVCLRDGTKAAAAKAAGFVSGLADYHEIMPGEYLRLDLYPGMTKISFWVLSPVAVIAGEHIMRGSLVLDE